MALSELDRVAALVVIDLQKGFAGIPAAHPMEAVVDRAGRLARGFRERGLPVVLVNVTGLPEGRREQGGRLPPMPDGWTDIMDELGAAPGDVLVSKRAPGAFHGTALDAELRGRGVTQVLFAGVATTNGVEATARGAFDLGYHVVAVTDAMTDPDGAAHAASIEKVFPRIGQTCATEDVLRLLAERG